jgi:hypothetical protein
MGKQPHGIHIDSEAHADSYPLGVEQQEYKTDHASLLNARVKKMGMNFHFLIHLHAMVHIKKELEFLNKVTHIQVP